MAHFDPKLVDAPAASAAPQTSIAGRIRNYFLTGLVVAGPLAVTVWLIWSFINWVDSFVTPAHPAGRTGRKPICPGRSPAPDW